MANLKDVIYLSNEDYETLVSTGTVTIDGTTLTYDENCVYITPDKLASTTEDGLMSASDKTNLDTIKSAYLKSASVSSNTLTLTKQDNTTVTYTPSFSDTNYYHTPLFNSGLKIGTGIGVNDLYVPNASETQSGVVSTGAQTFAGRKTFGSNPIMNGIYNSIKGSEIIGFGYDSNSGSLIYTDGHLQVNGDDDDNYYLKPSNATGMGDPDTFYFNTGIGIMDSNGVEDDIKLQFPNKSGTFALLSDTKIEIVDLTSLESA